LQPHFTEEKRKGNQIAKTRTPKKTEKSINGRTMIMTGYKPGGREATKIRVPAKRRKGGRRRSPYAVSTHSKPKINLNKTKIRRAPTTKTGRSNDTQ